MKWSDTMNNVDVINIKISGIADQQLINALKVINDSFFKTSTINEAEDVTYDIVMNEVRQAGQISVTGTLNEHVINLTKPLHPENEARIVKYTYLGVYLNLLQAETKQVQPWGLLSGMRPTKMVHNMKKRGFSDEEIKNYLQREYFVSDEKMALLLQVANQQLSVIPDLYEIQDEVSLYIGIPFCPTRCAYCTFAAYAYGPFKKWVNPFLETLLEEIKQVGAYIKAHQIPVTSIYFGGGTATTLSAEQFELLTQTVFEHIATADEVREITVEAGRPDTIDEEKLALLKRYKMERISINPQSFNQDTLDRIGRHHTVEDVVDKFNLAKQYAFENVNMDIIVGLPGENQVELSHTLDELAKLQPESLTVHMLAFKRKSELTKNRGLYTTANDEELNEMAQMTYDFAKTHDYIPYYLYRQKNISANMENIGYSKKGHESVYNILMMEEAQNVLGLGVGASSKYLIGTSVHNPKDIKAYIETYEQYVTKKLEILEQSLSIVDVHTIIY